MIYKPFITGPAKTLRLHLAYIFWRCSTTGLLNYTSVGRRNPVPGAFLKQWALGVGLPFLHCTYCLNYYQVLFVFVFAAPLPPDVSSVRPAVPSAAPSGTSPVTRVSSLQSWVLVEGTAGPGPRGPSYEHIMNHSSFVMERFHTLVFLSLLLFLRKYIFCIIHEMGGDLDCYLGARESPLDNWSHVCILKLNSIKSFVSWRSILAQRGRSADAVRSLSSEVSEGLRVLGWAE